MKVTTDYGIVLVRDVDRVEDVVQALEKVKAERDLRPDFLVVQTNDGQFVGIVPSSALVRAGPEELISDQRALGNKRRVVALDAPDEDKEAAVSASRGLALGMAHSRPVAVLRPEDLNIDGGFRPKRFPFPGEPSILCPCCGDEISWFETNARMTDTGVILQDLCPLCGCLIPEVD